MKKKLFSILIVLMTLVVALPTAFVAFATEESTSIPLATNEDVYALASIVNGEANEFAYSAFNAYYPDDADTLEEKRAFLRTAKFVITADMTLSSADGFMGIGKDATNSFAGSIDGQNHTITWAIDSTDYAEGTTQAYFGLVGYVVKDENVATPTLSNLNFDGKILSDNCFYGIGASAGWVSADCVVEAVTSSTEISLIYEGTEAVRVGGIVSALTGSMTSVRCTAKLTINSTSDNWTMLGGLTGYMYDGAVIKNASFNGELNGYSDHQSALTTGLITAYSRNATFENITATGDVYANILSSDGYLYNGALGGRTGSVTAKNIVIYDSKLYVGHETTQARIGTLIAGVHGSTTLVDCLVKDCEVVISGETGDAFHVGTVAGYIANSLVMQNVVSNAAFRTNGDIGTGTSFAGFVQGYTSANSANNLFSVNKAGVLTAVASGATNVGIAGFYASERVATTESADVVIATNSASNEASKLSELDIKWGIREGDAITEGLPEGMSITYDEATGQIATLTTTDTALGTYDLVAYVERTVNDVLYTLEMADVTIVVSEAVPTVTGVEVYDGGDVVDESLSIQALSPAKTLTAQVLASDVEDTAGVIWKFYDTLENELSPALMGQYVTLTKDGNDLIINPDLSIREEYTFSVRAISVVDDTKYAEFTVTITVPTVEKILFTPDDGAVGEGTEDNPYVLYVGNNLTGKGEVYMNDDLPHNNQKFTTTISILVGKDTNDKNHLTSSITLNTNIILTAKCEGRFKVTLTSVTDTSITKEIYVIVKAPVTAFTVTSSDIEGNVIRTETDNFNTVLGSLIANPVVSQTTLREYGNGAEIADYTPYREIKTAIFATLDSSIATIDSDGRVTVKDFGYVTFTATTDGVDKNGDKLTATYDLLIEDSTKGDQDAPSGLAPVDTQYCDTTDGKITGLDADKTYEYRLATAHGYTPVPTGVTVIENLAAGTYHVRLAGNDEFNPSADVELTINLGGKHTQDAPSGLEVQNATAGSLVGAILHVNDKMEYTTAFGSVYHPISGEGDTFTLANFEVGSYRIRFAETDTHLASADVIITVKYTVSIIWVENDFIYDGTDQSQKVTATYKDINGNPVDLQVVLTDGVFKNAGNDCTFSASFAYDEILYALPSENTKVYTIAKREIGLTWSAPTDLVYNGLAKVPTVSATGVVSGDTVNVTVDLTLTNDNVNVGTFTYYATSVDNANYRLPIDVSSDSYTIIAKDISSAVITLDTSPMYTGSEVTQGVTSVEIDGLTVTFTVSGNVQTNVGATDYTLIVTGNGNFTGTATKGWNIAKANAVITLGATDIVKTYGESWELPVATSNFGTVVCDTLISDLVNVNTYTVTYTVAGTTNYDGDTATLSVTIEKATFDMTSITFTDETFKYDGQAHSIAIGGALPGGVTVSYANNGQSEVGVYTVTATFGYDTANYNVIQPMTAVLTINNADFVGEVDTASGKPLVVVGSLDGFAPGVSVSVSEVDIEGVDTGDYLQSNETLVKVVDISLIKDGSVIQPNGAITIKILLPTELDGREFRVVHNHEGAFREVAYTVENGYAVFTTEELSQFLFVSKDSIPLGWILLGAGVVVLIVLLVVIFTKKKRRPDAPIDLNHGGSVAPVDGVTVSTHHDSEPIVSEGRTIVAGYKRSFMAKLIQSPIETKEFFVKVMNYLLSFGGVKYRTSWKAVTFYVGKKQIARLVIRGKTLNVHLALEPTKYSGLGFRVIDKSAVKSYSAVPLGVRVRSNRAVTHVVKLIEEIVQSMGLVKKDRVDILTTNSYPYETTEHLISRGLIKRII